MKIRRVLPSILAGGLLLLTISCNLPSRPTPTQGVPPLEQTITALYSTAAAPVPSETPSAAAYPSATPQLIQTATKAQPPTQAPSAPTATKVPPTPTPGIPDARSDFSTVASFMNPAPVIDGDWSEWKKVAREYPANALVYGKTNWKNEDDLSASYYVGWDATYLYIAVKVHDDKYVQIAKGADIYKGDSIELLLDTNLKTDYYYNKLSADDYQIGISAGNPNIKEGKREAYLWYPTSEAGTLKNVEIAALDEGAIYRVEAAIPWADLGVTPVKGMHMGFAISVSDDDNSGKAVQESMVSSDATRNLVDPTTWGDVVLK